MDSGMMGEFIAQCRKEKNLTQVQLAEKLGITNQAVSKWETGKGMPDVALMQQLCDVLGISLNELFSGRHLSDDEYKGKAEENFSRMLMEKQCENLKPLRNLFSVFAGVFAFVAAVELVIGFVGYFFNTEMLKVMLINATVWLVLFIPVFFKWMYDENKLKSVKKAGTFADAEIKDFIPAAFVRVANYNSGRVKCRFTYDGVERIALSSYYLMSPFTQKEDLRAFVYVDSANPQRYVVEVMRLPN